MGRWRLPNPGPYQVAATAAAAAVDSERASVAALASVAVADAQRAARAAPARPLPPPPLPPPQQLPPLPLPPTSMLDHGAVEIEEAGHIHTPTGYTRDICT